MAASPAVRGSSHTAHDMLQPRPGQAVVSRTIVPLTSWDGTDGHDPTEAGPLELIRCSRCQRVLSFGLEPAQGGASAAPLDASSAAGGMVRFGHNLYYCARCASMVGLKR